MTTANLVVNFTKEKTNEYYWTWHDGYQADRIFDEAIKKTKDFKFTNTKLDDLLTGKKMDFEDAFTSDGRGDWAWVLTVIDETHAVLTGAGCGDVKTKWLELK